MLMRMNRSLAGMQALIRIADDGGEEAVTVDDFALALENMAEPE